MNRTLAFGLLMVVLVGAAAVVAGWAYQNQVWLRDDYSVGYEYGSTLPDAQESSVATNRARAATCWKQAQTHSASTSAQVVFNGGCNDAAKGRDPRPEAAGVFVSDASDLWGPFG